MAYFNKNNKSSPKKKIIPALGTRKKSYHLGKKQASSRKSRQRQLQQWWRWSINSLLTIIIIAMPVSYWLGYPQHLLTLCKTCLIYYSGEAGFRIEEVFIEGRRYSEPILLSKTISAYRGQPIFTHDLEHLKTELEKINWIKSVYIQRRLPYHLYVKINERFPIALWQHHKNLFLVDKEGVVIHNALLEQFKGFPLVIGTDAPTYAPKILSLLEKFPNIKDKLSSLTRVRQRRWDLILNGSILVKLSEEKIEDALVRLSLLIEQGKINVGEVSVVDLRDPQQLILRLSPEALVKIKLKGTEA